MNYEDLSPELKEKAKACANAAELVELAKSEGIQLSDKELEAVAGGESRWDEIVGCDGDVCKGHGGIDPCSSQCLGLF